jgi:hypothetical protein
MPPTDPPLPPVRVILPDGQELRGVLHARQQFPRAGWLYWVGLPMWADVPETEAVEPREYRVWLTSEQARPIPGVSYDQVPTRPLDSEAPGPQAADRWVWKVQRAEVGEDGRAHRFVVHVADCAAAPADASELDVFGALEVLRLPGAEACPECGADLALGPLA